MEYKAKVVFAPDVWSKMAWFTENLTTEIGAVGTVKIRTENGDKYYYVDNIYFPKQKVTGATVTIDGDMWGELIKSVPLKELGRIGFYWHRHPAGSPHHSSTDEEDTYETFMSKDAKPQRKFFIFMQTAWDVTKKEIMTETRIDITSPIRATILDNNIQIEYEVSDKIRELEKAVEEEQQQIEEECKRIKEEIIINTTPTYSNNYNWNSWLSKPSKNNSVNFSFNNVEDDFVENVITDTKERCFAKNDLLEGKKTLEDDMGSIEFVNGEARIMANPTLRAFVETALVSGGSLFGKYREMKKNYVLDKHGEPTKTLVYRFQPTTKGFDELKSAIKKMFSNYNRFLIKDYKKDEVMTTDKETLIVDDKFELEGFCYSLLDKLEEEADIEWDYNNDKKMVGYIYEFDKNIFLGVVESNLTFSKLLFEGSALVKKVEPLTELLRNEVLTKFNLGEKNSSSGFVLADKSGKKK